MYKQKKVTQVSHQPGPRTTFGFDRVPREPTLYTTAALKGKACSRMDVQLERGLTARAVSSLPSRAALQQHCHWVCVAHCGSVHKSFQTAQPQGLNGSEIRPYVLIARGRDFVYAANLVRASWWLSRCRPGAPPTQDRGLFAEAANDTLFEVAGTGKPHLAPREGGANELQPPPWPSARRGWTHLPLLANGGTATGRSTHYMGETKA